MTLKELLTDFHTPRTEIICIVPKTDLDLKVVKEELKDGHYWIMDINTNNTIPEFPIELYAEKAAFCGEMELPGIDIVIQSDCDYSAFWKTHTRNKSMKF